MLEVKEAGHQYWEHHLQRHSQLMKKRGDLEEIFVKISGHARMSAVMFISSDISYFMPTYLLMSAMDAPVT